MILENIGHKLTNEKLYRVSFEEAGTMTLGRGC